MAYKRADESHHSDTKRLSISIPHDVYQALDACASSNDVSLAWVVRKALIDYLDRDIPLLRAGN